MKESGVRTSCSARTRPARSCTGESRSRVIARPSAQVAVKGASPSAARVEATIQSRRAWSLVITVSRGHLCQSVTLVLWFESRSPLAGVCCPRQKYPAIALGPCETQTMRTGLQGHRRKSTNGLRAAIGAYRDSGGHDETFFRRFCTRYACRPDALDRSGLGNAPPPGTVRSPIIAVPVETIPIHHAVQIDDEICKSWLLESPIQHDRSCAERVLWLFAARNRLTKVSRLLVVGVVTDPTENERPYDSDIASRPGRR